jgi:hypothetical protein
MYPVAPGFSKTMASTVSIYEDSYSSYVKQIPTKYNHYIPTTASQVAAAKEDEIKAFTQTLTQPISIKKYGPTLKVRNIKFNMSPPLEQYKKPTPTG